MTTDYTSDIVTCRGVSRISRGRERQPSRRGAPAYKFARFSGKLHEIEKKMDLEWGHVPSTPLCWIRQCYMYKLFIRILDKMHEVL